MKTFCAFEREDSDDKIALLVSDQDMQRFIDLPRHSQDAIEIFDERSGKAYLVRRATCGEPCRCGAALIAVVEGVRHPNVWQGDAS